MRKTWLFFAVVIAVTALIYFGLERYEATSSPLPVYGPENHEIPEFGFRTQDDEYFNRNKMEGKIAVVNYFFTSCPSICPRMTRNLQAVHDLYRNDDDLIMMSLTVDPKRDTPERLAMFADNYNADSQTWKFLTGDKKDLYHLARKGFLVSATEGAGDHGDFIHSENIVLIDRSMRIRGFYNGTDEGAISDLIRDIAKLKKQRA